MATTILSFASLSNFNLPGTTKYPKSTLRFPLFTSLPLPSTSLSLSSFFLVRKEAYLSLSSTPIQALAEEAVDTSDLASSSKLVLVVGGTGGVGQLVVASLLKRIIRSRLLLRDLENATRLFGKQDENSLKVVKGDTRNAEELDPSMFELFLPRGGAEKTHLIKLGRCEESHFSIAFMGEESCSGFIVGVTKSDELPWRPGRLTDGPYTSYDLNTLLKATAGELRAVVIGQGDKLVGEVSRLVVAEACIQALDIEFPEDKAYGINSVKGEGPGSDPQKWQELFKLAESK